MPDKNTDFLDFHVQGSFPPVPAAYSAAPVLISSPDALWWQWWKVCVDNLKSLFKGWKCTCFPLIINIWLPKTDAVIAVIVFSSDQVRQCSKEQNNLLHLVWSVQVMWRTAFCLSGSIAVAIILCEQNMLSHTSAFPPTWAVLFSCWTCERLYRSRLLPLMGMFQEGCLPCRIWSCSFIFFHELNLIKGIVWSQVYYRSKGWLTYISILHTAIHTWLLFFKIP